MINYINNLKTKPEHIRKRFAFMFASTFTIIVFAGWVASFGLVNNSTLSKNTDKKSNQNINIDRPVSSLSATAIGEWSDIKSIFFGSNKVEFSNDSIEVLPGNR
jgi:hypothetical protein